jgi:hypothetical protein
MQNKITGSHLGGFQHNRSVPNHIFYIHQMLYKNWKCNGPVHQLYIDFKKAYDSIRMEVLSNILLSLVPL